MDAEGNMKEKYHNVVLHTLIMNCADFKEEKSAMEVLLDELSSKSLNNQKINLLVSLKYHCKLAAEGVEYCWGLSKKYFRNEGFEKKIQKASLNKLLESQLNM